MIIVLIAQQDEEYKTAAGCFKAANRFPYFHWAQGKFEISMGLIPDGKESFRKAARAFFEEGEHSSTLELLALVMDMGWNPDDDYIYEKSKEKCPSFFTAEKSIRFALERNKWSEITVENLKSKSTAQLFLPYRGNDHLMEKLALCSEVDREDIECSLPLFVGKFAWVQLALFECRVWISSNSILLQGTITWRKTNF